MYIYKIILTFLCAFLLVFKTANAAQITPNKSENEVTIYYTYSTPLVINGGQPSYGSELISLLKAAFEKQNLVPTFTPSPWARIMRQAPLENNALIIQIIRTKEREDNFHWIIPTSSEENVTTLFTRNDEAHKNLSKQQITTGAFKAVCRLKSAQCKMLKDYGFKDDNLFIMSETKPGMLENFIMRGRFDFYASNFRTMNTNISILSNQPNFDLLIKTNPPIIPVSTLNRNLDYVAAPKSIDPDLLVKIKKALQNFTLPARD